VGIELQPQICGGNETSCKYIHLAHRLIVPRCVSERGKVGFLNSQTVLLSPGSLKDTMADMVGRLNSRQLTWKIRHQSCVVKYDAIRMVQRISMPLSLAPCLRALSPCVVSTSKITIDLDRSLSSCLQCPGDQAGHIEQNE